MQNAIAVVVGASLFLGSLGAMIVAFVHGIGFSLLLKQPKPKFLSRLTIQIVSWILCGAVLWLLYGGQSVSQAIAQMLALPIVDGALYLLITTKLTQFWYNMDWRSAAKSLRIIHIIWLAWVVLWFGLTVAAVSQFR
jgi:hypothetical protein